jgi:5-methylcytosine-specific restriction endonuclease McrA
MLEQQRYRCALTGDRLTPENLALDHIVPISEGGGFDVENSQLVTRDANRAKHTMSQSDFVQLCKNVSQTSRTN